MIRRILVAALFVSALLEGGAVSGDAGAQQVANLSVLGYKAPVPPTWQAQPPSSGMRLAQYRVPGAGGDAEAVVFYFGKGQGGSVEANTERWISQFKTTDGKPVAPRIQRSSVDGVPVTTVELTGSYARGVGMGPQGAAKPNQTLLVAVFETPEGNLTLQLHGPNETVSANRQAFEALVRGFRRAS